MIGASSAGCAGHAPASPTDRPPIIGERGLGRVLGWCHERAAAGRVRVPDRAGLRAGGPARVGRRRSSSASPGSSPSPAGSTRPCTPPGPGRCGSTPASAPPTESNHRYHQLLAAGTTGLSVAFDLPDPDGLRLATTRSPAARWARSGSRSTRSTTCASCSTASRSTEVSTSMTINAPAAVLLLLYQLVAEEQGVGGRRSWTARSRTTCSRSTSRAAPTSTRRRPRCGSPPTSSPTAASEIPRWNTISISGYHMAEAGATPAQEIAFTLANGIAVRAGRHRQRSARRRLRAAAGVLLRLPHDDARGGRQVPRGPPDLGAAHAGGVRRARTRSR